MRKEKDKKKMTIIKKKIGILIESDNMIEKIEEDKIKEDRIEEDNKTEEEEIDLNMMNNHNKKNRNH